MTPVELGPWTQRSAISSDRLIVAGDLFFVERHICDDKIHKWMTVSAAIYAKQCSHAHHL